MNNIAREGREFLTFDFAIRGETRFDTFFWRRPFRAYPRDGQSEG